MTGFYELDTADVLHFDQVPFGTRSFGRSLCAAFLFLISLSSLAQDPKAYLRPLEDGPYGLRLLSQQARGNMAAGNYAGVERSFAELNSPEQTLLDGRWKLTAFSLGVQSFISDGNLWPARYEAIKQWREKYPRSSAAAAAEAMYWRLYAWHARGKGFASTVTKEGWQLFYERLQKAERVLQQSNDYGVANPLWYYEYLELALASGWPLSDYRKLFEEATAKAPTFYPHYFAMATRLLPKWGGNYDLIDQFAAQSVTKTQATHGTSMYARIYWYVDQEESLNFDLFKNSNATWPRLRKGFEDLIARTPQSHWNRNAFASFACRAGDRKTYTTLRSQIQDNVHQEAWQSNYSLDLCDHKFPRLKG